MAKRITVFKVDEIDDLNHPRRSERRATLDATQAALRALKPLGLKFSTETIDGGATTVTAWIASAEPRVKSERKALGKSVTNDDPRTLASDLVEDR